MSDSKTMRDATDAHPSAPSGWGTRRKVPDLSGRGFGLRRSTWIVAGLVFGASANLAAQEARPDTAGQEIFELEPLLVEVTRSEQRLNEVPQSVSLIGQEEIQVNQRQVTPVSALQPIPGVLALERRNFSLSGGVRLSIRAPVPRFGMRGLQLLQDGIPLTTADGTTQPGNLDMGSAGSIEVVRGPSSVLYGNSAGGVISVETEFPPDRALLVSPEVQFGTHGYERQQLKAQGSTGLVDYVASASRLEIDGFREHSRQRVRKLNLVGRTDLGESTEIRGVFNLFDTPFAENSSTLTREDARENPTSVRSLAISQGWGESATQGQGGLTLRHSFSESQSLRVTGWGMWRDVWNPIPFGIVDVERVGTGLRSEYRGELSVGSVPLRWTAGFDVSSQDDDRQEFENEGVPAGGGDAVQGALLQDQTETVRSLAPFVQAALQLRTDWTATVGIRWDYYDFEVVDRFLSDGDQSGDRTLDQASPTVGLTYSPSPKLNIYGNYATAYQTPTTVELSNRPSGEGGFNPDLEPADLRSFEIGIRGLLEGPRMRYEIAGYTSTLVNGLVRFEGPSERAFFRNAGESSRDGLEVLLEWLPISTLRTRLAYTYQDFEYVRFAPEGNDFSGNTEPGAPPHRVFAGITHESSYGLRSSLNVQWMDAYPVNDANTVSNWAHEVVDIRIGLDRTWNGYRIRPVVGIDNVLDERYNASVIPNAFGDRYFEPAPDREFYFGLTVSGGTR